MSVMRTEVRRMKPPEAAGGGRPDSRLEPPGGKQPLILAPEDLFGTSGPPKCTIISVCCFKILSLW